jgi:hypothetical protein
MSMFIDLMTFYCGCMVDFFFALQRRRPGALQLQHAPALRHCVPCQY